MTILAMSLKIKSWRNIAKWSVLAILCTLFLVFIIRIVIFEHNYYSEKEGSERAIAEENLEVQEELIEIVPTKEEVQEYHVADDHPRYLSIARLGIEKARILPMGVNSKGELATPNNIFDVGWYEASGKPGQGGTIIIDGHNGGPHKFGVFKNLPELSEGDEIIVERGDGEIFVYEVVENKTVSLGDADAYMKTAARSPISGKESVTLISCTGDWSKQQNTYLSRQFTRAIIRG